MSSKFNFSSLGKPTTVLLGDQNLADPNDAQPASYRIKRIIVHSQYVERTKKNDIALLELMKTVTFTKFIRPGCLQQSADFDETVVAVRKY